MPQVTQCSHPWEPPVFMGSLLLPWAAEGEGEKGQDLDHATSNIPAWIWLWWAQVLMSRKGSTFRKHQEPTSGLNTGGCVPVRLGQGPPQLPPPPPASHPVHTCLGGEGGLEDSGADSPPVPGRGAEWVGQRGHIKGTQPIPDALLRPPGPAQPHPNLELSSSCAQASSAPACIKGHLLREAINDSPSLLRTHLPLGCLSLRAPIPVCYHTLECMAVRHGLLPKTRLQQLLPHRESRDGLGAWHKTGARHA